MFSTIDQRRLLQGRIHRPVVMRADIKVPAYGPGAPIGRAELSLIANILNVTDEGVERRKVRSLSPQAIPMRPLRHCLREMPCLVFDKLLGFLVRHDSDPEDLTLAHHAEVWRPPVAVAPRKARPSVRLDGNGDQPDPAAAGAR
jgi:hypothetical protein